MAEHDGAAAQAESVDAESGDDAADAVDDAEDIDAEDAADQDSDKPVRKSRARQWLSGVSKPVAVAVAIIVALVGLGGWLAFRVHQDHQVQAQRNLYLQVARQTAINLTTISYTEVDADIKRVLDSATGGFHDEFGFLFI